MRPAVSIGLSQNGGWHWISIDFTTLQIRRRGRISGVGIGDPGRFGGAERNLNSEVVNVEPGGSLILAVGYAAEPPVLGQSQRRPARDWL